MFASALLLLLVAGTPEEEMGAMPTTSKAPAFHVTAGLRSGVLIRPPSADPTLSFHGALRGGTFEPLVLMGVTIAPGKTLTVWEVPLAIGFRIPIVFSAWSLVPEILAGARMHFYTASELDSGGVGADLTGMLGLSLLREIGPFKLGLRVGLDLATPREHILVDQVLWTRGPVGFSVQLHIER